MKNNTKLFVGVIMFGIMLGLCACNNDTPTTQEGLTQDEANVLWETEANGTLKISNGTTKDMVVFNGQTPSITNIIGTALRDPYQPRNGRRLQACDTLSEPWEPESRHRESGLPAPASCVLER